MMRSPPHLPTCVVATEAHAQVLNRVQRWAAATDSHVVRRLWPAQPDGAQHALCPGCGGPLSDGMLITLNQTAGSVRAGPAQQALAAGDIGALTPELPLEPGELWCVVCLPCVEDYRQTPSEPWLSERLLGLVDAALRSD
jgi:hypothetical protein